MTSVSSGGATSKPSRRTGSTAAARRGICTSSSRRSWRVQRSWARWTGPLCALKATAAPHYKELIGPCLSDGTRILALMNGLGVEDQLADLFGAERVYGGLAYVAINRDAPGVIRHMALGRITIGRFLADAGEKTQALGLWADTKIPATLTPSLLMSRCDKLG